MPTIIQTNLIIEPNWEDVTKKAKNLEHIIWKCEPLAIAPPSLQDAGPVPSLYSHIAQSQDQDPDNIPKLFKSTKGTGGKKSGKGKQKCQQQPQSPPPAQEEEEHYEETTIIIIMKTIEAITEATDPTGDNKEPAESLLRFPTKGKGPTK